MDVSRRSFIKSTAVALASAAAAGTLSTMVGCSPKENTPSNGADTETKLSVCRFCGCGCGVLVQSKNGKLISVVGDPDNDSNRG